MTAPNSPSSADIGETRIARDLETILDLAEKNGTLGRLKSVAIYFDEVELRAIVKSLRGVIPDAAQSVGMREALIAAKCTSPDGTYIHASMDDVLRAIAAQPPAAPVETRPRDHFIAGAIEDGAAPVETDRKTFTIPDGYEAVRDCEGQATGEVRPRSSAEPAAAVETTILTDPPGRAHWAVAHGGSSAATEQADRGTITRNLRGLASRMEYRVEAIEARDGKGQSAITGRGVGIGYLLAKDLAEALTEAATYIEGSPPTSISELPDDIRVPLHELQADVDYMIGRMIESGNSAPVITETIKSKLTALEVAIRSCAEPQAHAGIKSDLAECVEQGELRGRDLKQVFNPTERRLIAAALRAQPQAARQWPRVFNVQRSKFNHWHGDISFARCPTDDELKALEILLRDDHQPAPSLPRPQHSGETK